MVSYIYVANADIGRLLKMKSSVMVLLEDLKDMVQEHGVLKGIWYSDIFNPFYRLCHLPSDIYNYIQKFYYYGKIGASKTYDFDASSIDVLIYSHIKRVRKFMDSEDTHLVWNGKRTGLMKKLYEFEELCKRKCKNDDFNDMYYFSKEFKKYGLGKKVEFIRNGQKYYTYEKSDDHKKATSLARKKDEKIAKQRTKRYYELLEKYVPQFWD